MHQPPITIDSQLGQRENNFTFIRLIAAYAVLIAHSFALTSGRSGQDPISHVLIAYWGEGLGSIAVNVFFVISGFLVAGSYLHRDNLLAFIEARVLRIFPGLFVAVSLSVFILGPAVTTNDWSSYFSSNVVWQYLWHNVTLFSGVHYRLPGVFLDNPWPAGVNGSLWTLPIEIYMYCMLATLGAIGILKNRPVFNLFALVILGTYALVHGGFIPSGGVKPRALDLLALYTAGSFLFVNRQFIPLNWAVVVLLFGVYFVTKGNSAFYPVKILFFTYLVIFLSLYPGIQAPALDRVGDFSYGVYIYAFPVQQLLIQYYGLSPIALLLISTLITGALACFSWYFIEKPALSYKGRMPMGRKWLDPRSTT